MSPYPHEYRRAKELLSETLVDDIEKLKAELDKYRKALEFYADEKSYVKLPGLVGMNSAFDRDKGKRARKELSEEELTENKT